MEATRARIVAAGVELARALPTCDWSSLTFRAVAERAGVGERTVYRHFPTERILRTAIMAGIAEAAGVDYGSVRLDTVGDVAERVFRSLGSFEGRPAPPPRLDPAFDEAGRQRREALLRAVRAERPGWSDGQVVALAATLDVLWAVPSYERLVDHWRLEPDVAVEILKGAIAAVTRSEEGPASDW